jgi:MinD superfamily P-loop ATPase
MVPEVKITADPASFPAMFEYDRCVHVPEMIRRTIAIDKEKCDGCGRCADACHEGAIAMVGGKAEVVREEHCDGLGDCLPVCRAGAISFVIREAAPFAGETPENGNITVVNRSLGSARWPIQIKLVPLKAERYNGADILLAADCTAFVSQDFHKRFVKDRIVLIGCTKFDAGDYTERLTQILMNNDVRSILTVRMEVPCCGAMDRIVKGALAKSQRKIPYKVVVLATDGTVLSS